MQHIVCSVQVMWGYFLGAIFDHTLRLGTCRGFSRIEYHLFVEIHPLDPQSCHGINTFSHPHRTLVTHTAHRTLVTHTELFTSNTNSKFSCAMPRTYHRAAQASQIHLTCLSVQQKTTCYSTSTQKRLAINYSSSLIIKLIVARNSRRACVVFLGRASCRVFVLRLGLVLAARDSSSWVRYPPVAKHLRVHVSHGTLTMLRASSPERRGCPSRTCSRHLASAVPESPFDLDFDRCLTTEHLQSSRTIPA